LNLTFNYLIIPFFFLITRVIYGKEILNSNIVEDTMWTPLGNIAITCLLSFAEAKTETEMSLNGLNKTLASRWFTTKRTKRLNISLPGIHDVVPPINMSLTTIIYLPRRRPGRTHQGSSLPERHRACIYRTVHNLHALHI